MLNHTHLSALIYIFICIIIATPFCLSLPCNLTDPTLSKCLHIFLERDYALIEQVLYDSSTIKEGNELAEYVCRWVINPKQIPDDSVTLVSSCFPCIRPVNEMISCYEEQLDRCSVYFYIRERVRMLQIISSLSDSYDVMCDKNNLDAGIRAIKESLPCLESARRYGYCDAKLNMQANLFFKKLMRYEITSRSACKPLADFRSCLMVNSRTQLPPCKSEAREAMRKALDSWLHHLCTRVGYYFEVQDWPAHTHTHLSSLISGRFIFYFCFKFAQCRTGVDT